MKTYRIPRFLPTSSSGTVLHHRSQLRRCRDLNPGPQCLQSGAQSTELPHLISVWNLTSVTKYPPKSPKLKNKKMGLSKIRERFINFNFWGGIFTKTSLRIWVQHKILDFLILCMTFLKIRNSPLGMVMFKIFWLKNLKWEKRQKFTKNAFSKIVLDIFRQSKPTWNIVNFKNHLTLQCRQVMTMWAMWQFLVAKNR
jgi:hypothetical protein